VAVSVFADTVFFIPGVQRLVRGLDSNLPYMLSDWYWVPYSLKNVAPRCLPCGFDLSGACPPMPSRAVLPVGFSCCGLVHSSTRLQCEGFLGRCARFGLDTSEHSPALEHDPAAQPRLCLPSAQAGAEAC
jgi:hypothetical protein